LDFEKFGSAWKLFHEKIGSTMPKSWTLKNLGLRGSSFYIVYHFNNNICCAWTALSLSFFLQRIVILGTIVIRPIMVVPSIKFTVGVVGAHAVWQWQW
jgi:hypothetical protein